MLHQLRENYKESLKARNQLLKPLTTKENQLFNKISNDLRLNSNNLPGFFFVQFTHSYLLETPSYVWQTWFYSWNIWKKTQSQAIPVLSMNQVYKDLCKLIENGYFRMNKANEKKYLKHLIYECVLLYKELGVLVDIDNERKEIRYDQIPTFQQMEPNIFVELYYNQIQPMLDVNFDINNNEIPEGIRKSVFLFKSNWMNTNNGYFMKDEYKWSEKEKVDHVVIYTDQNMLDRALKILTDDQKRAISIYLKKYPYNAERICELLIQRHGASGLRMSDGKYTILPYVEEYVFSSIWLWK